MGSSDQNGTSGGKPCPDGEGLPGGCPDDARLESLLEAEEGSPEHLEFDRHLERCPHCPGRLEALWGKTADSATAGLTDGLTREHFDRILDRISAQTTAREYDLSFLPLSLRAECLGQLGPYHLERVIGSGGMGLVFQALDSRTGERVALKTLRGGRSAPRDLRERFLREGRVAQPVRHPGVLAVRDAGTDTGIPYLVTPLLSGQSFDSLIRGKAPLPAADAVEWARQAAEALGAAHRFNIVHRDIKPSNLWLRAGDDPQRVCVLDFGLALQGAPTGAERLTTTGAMLGTPAYIAPEQANGHHAGPPADVFSLGCVLYEMLTGRRVFPGDNALQVLRAIATFRVVPAERFRPDLPRALRDILARCLELAPGDRYPDAVALAEDLRRVQAGQKSLYPPAGRAEQLRRWVARHPALAGTTALVAVALSMATLVSLYQASEARRARASAEAEVEVSRLTAERNRQLLYYAGVRSALNSYTTGKPSEALGTLGQLEDDPEFQPILGWEWQQLAGLCRESILEMPVDAWAGSLPTLGLAEAGPGVFSACNRDGFIRIDWAGKKSRHFPAEAARDARVGLTLAPDGGRGAWLTPEGAVKLVDLQSGALEEVCRGLERGKGRISHVALGPGASGRLYVYIQDPDKSKSRLVAWDLRAGKATHTQAMDLAPGRNFAASPDGSALLAPVEKGRWALWRPGAADALLLTDPVPLDSPTLYWRGNGENAYALGRDQFQTRLYHWDLRGAPGPVDMGTARPDQVAPGAGGTLFAFDNQGAIHRLEGGVASRVPGHVGPGLYQRAMICADSRFPLLGISRRGTVTRSALVAPAATERFMLPPHGSSLATDLHWMDDSHLVARQTRNDEGYSQLTLLRHGPGAGDNPWELTLIRTIRVAGRCLVAPAGGNGRMLVAGENGCLWLDRDGETDTGVKLGAMPQALLPAQDGFCGIEADGTLFGLDRSLRKRWSRRVPGAEEGAGEKTGFTTATDGSSVVVLWRNGEMATLSCIGAGDGAILSSDTRQDLCAVADMTMVSRDHLALAAGSGNLLLHSLPERRTLLAREGMDRIPQYLAYSRAAGRLASIDLGGQVDLWDTRFLSQIPIVSDPQNNRSSIPLRLVFSPNGGKLAYLGEDGSIRVLTAWETSPP